MNKYVLIVAGGKGLRMGDNTPKQFLPLAGKPLLMHTLETFYRYDKGIYIILVLPFEHQAYWKELCEKHHFSIPHQIVVGGETRFHSVQNGLALIQEEGLIGVHDGVRPFVSQEVIARCYQEAERNRAVIPVIDVVETIRHLTREGVSETVTRDRYKLVQTPQVFVASLLKQAYRLPYNPQFTDDASVVEALGENVSLTMGNRENIKITTPFDLKIGELLVKLQ